MTLSTEYLPAITSPATTIYIVFAGDSGTDFTVYLDKSIT